MLHVNAELTLWTLAPLPIMSVVIYYVSDVINRKSMDVQVQQSRLSTLAQELQRHPCAESLCQGAHGYGTLPRSGGHLS